MPTSWSDGVNIIVCIKRVPDTEARVRIAAGETAIESDGVKYIMSPYDEFALEAALRTKEEGGEGEVTVLTLGDDSSQETLRAALAVGADAAILLQGTVTVDGLATAKALAAELKQHDAPLVLFGVKSGDIDQQPQAGRCRRVVAGAEGELGRHRDHLATRVRGGQPIELAGVGLAGDE